jgi:hypothetical protein
MNATSGESFDTERDFADAERHLLQKLFIWKEMASSTAEFRKKKEDGTIPAPSRKALP